MKKQESPGFIRGEQVNDPRMQTHYDRTAFPPPGWSTYGTHADQNILLEFSDQCDGDGLPLWERPAPGPKPWETRVGPKVVPDPNLIADTVFDHALGDEGGGLFCGCGWEPVDPEGFEDWCGHVAAEIVKALTEHAQKRPEGPRSDEQPAEAAVGTPAPAGPPEGRYADALHLLSVVDTIKATGGAVEIRGVRIEPCDTYGQTDTTRRANEAARRAEQAEATLARVREASRNHPDHCDHYPDPEEDFCGWKRAVADMRAALDPEPFGPDSCLDLHAPGCHHQTDRDRDRATLARVQALLDQWNDDWEDGRPIDLKCIDELETVLYPPGKAIAKDPPPVLYGVRWQVRKARHRRELAWEAFNRRDVFPSRHATQPEALAYADRQARGQV